MAARARSRARPPRVAAPVAAEVLRGLPPPAAGPPARAARVHRGRAASELSPRRGCRRGSCASRSSTRQMVPGALAGAADRHRRRPGARGWSSTSASWSGSPTCAGSSGSSTTSACATTATRGCRGKSGPPRVIERPKPRLKALQRRILHELLDWIPVHDAAHGFVRGRSARTHAALHTGRRVVVRLDLEDFFAAVTAARVFGIFRTAGYPESVAHMLTGLCTNVVPARRVGVRALPAGAPPRDAAPPAGRADLARAGEPRGVRARPPPDRAGAPPSAPATPATPTISCSRATPTCARPVGDDRRDRRRRGLPRERGQDPRDGPRARQTVTGIVVNARPNVPRAEYDLLKAILHRAALHGPAGLDPAHLLGRIAWVESLNPARGAKLRAAFTPSPGQTLNYWLYSVDRN